MERLPLAMQMSADEDTECLIDSIEDIAVNIDFNENETIYYFADGSTLKNPIGSGYITYGTYELKKPSNPQHKAINQAFRYSSGIMARKCHAKTKQSLLNLGYFDYVYENGHTNFRLTDKGVKAATVEAMHD